VDISRAQVVNLNTTQNQALIIPVPEISRFALPEPFKGQTGHTWALNQGTSVLGAQCILLEGLLRPDDWTYRQDPRRCQLPTSGAFHLGLEVGRTNTYPQWAALDLLDRASKKGKGQLPVLIGALFHGKEAHLSLHAGGNDMAQLKLPGFGVVTTS
jgi:hypothetical protein